MRNKTKEEILKEWDKHGIFSKTYRELAIMAMTEYGFQCQKTLTTRILELEAQIESLTNLAVMEVSCKCDDCEYFNNILTPKKP